MDKLLKRRSIFSGNITEKIDADFRTHPHQEIYCEGQNVNGQNIKEEEHDVVIMKEKKKNRFFANYNMFF
ncbi:MAG: hypothetical protein LBG28_09675 [Tannerella sp.]|nr:hypothetical protein [Tannerella sp.]